MLKIEDITYSVPRFLSFINLAYLLEAAKTGDEQFSKKIEACSKNLNTDEIGNINATRQMLLRSVFITSYAIFEQNLDEIVYLKQKQLNIKISPSDLKDSGITRSINYAKKVLHYQIDTNKINWKELLEIQKLRNHLVHYGESFDESAEHTNRFRAFKTSKYVTLRPEICFTINQIEEIFSLYMCCISDFNSNSQAPNPSINRDG